MRPPMQPAALQQIEVHRQHSIQYPLQQQSQQHQQQHPPHLPHHQSQLSAQVTAIDTPNQQARKFKFEQHDFAVEKHLNFVTGTATATTGVPKLPPRSHTHQQQQQQQQQQQPTYQQHSQFARPSGRPVRPGIASANDDCIQLLDFGKSPPHVPLHSAAYAAAQHSAVADTFRRASSAHRSSVSSQYSRSSSSEDGSISGDRLLSYQRASHFDDAAENFIIHFPADSPSHNQNDCGLSLPLSETEPLLTNVEATVADTQRAIRLSKNSASLIFTKKEVLPPKTAALPRHCAPAATVHSAANNNCNTQKRQQQTQLQHSLSLRSATDYNRKQAKHLPATYQQQSAQQLQHRRSLQLNYNNNLVTTSSCSANNNYCCPVGPATAKYSAGGSNGVDGAALHAKHNHHQHPGALTTSASASASAANANANANINTTAATRKQHAYSWYAPVYSALEEELEHDSRDSSPIHNLANTKKQHTSHYQHRSTQNSTSAADNETVALLETRNQINIQPQLHAQANHTNGREGGRHQHSHSQTQRRSNAAAPAPTSLPLAHAHNAALNSGGGGGVGVGGVSGGNGIRGVVSDDADYNGGVLAPLNGYEVEAPLVSSLGLTGGQLPRRRRIENFLKSLVGLKPSSARSSNNSSHASNAEPAATPMPIANGRAQLPLPASPEITITRTPSEQHLVALRDPAGRSNRQELLSCNGDKPASGSTSSLNVVQQKLWNIMRRNGSATSLHQEKSQSIVQYKGMRKCETVLALTRQTQSLCSPVFGGSGAMHANGGGGGGGMRRTHTTGSGIFNANGVEQIRPLNRLRNSVSNMNATCSRCSSLLSLAASGSRYSLNVAASGGFVHAALPTSVSQQQLQILSTLECRPPLHSSQQHQQQQQQRKTSTVSSSNVSSSNISSSRQRDDAHCGADNGSATFVAVAAAPAGASARHSSGNCSRKSSAGANSAHSASSNSPPSNLTTATLNSSYTPSTPASTPTTPTPTPTSTPTVTHSATSQHANAAGLLVDLPASALLSTTAPPSPSAITPTPAPAPASPTYAPAARKSASHAYPFTITSLLSMSSNELAHDLTDGSGAGVSTALKSSSVKHQPSSQSQPPAPAPFQPFTCKLCLVDVDAADEATTLQQCGCQFCTECMKAYVDFEITEGAYEISCPDAQCPAQGIMMLPEIANLSTTNLMKKHHRYRLNKEIEMDKTRTWCPRAGCETVCLVGAGTHSDAAPSTSTAHGSTLTPTADGAAQLLCAVQCPSCKDEFCSACKKAWHPNVSCEENSRRLVADGQDDIGIPFDNDLIKSCPMCHVPIEKDEGCAQMMCKRCKHVFCWYCLASLDDDFLLRHYDRGPCKNKLGHSRASVVWHRAQVIGIFAGFGILLLVASPLLLLAAPCIICCKCRSCSGSKIDEGDGELDEAAALQS